MFRNLRVYSWDLDVQCEDGKIGFQLKFKIWII